MTTKPQSDADVAREIAKVGHGLWEVYGPYHDKWRLVPDKVEALIAQHVAARTKPLVEALGDMEGGLELMRMAIMGHADRTELTKRINLLIKDCQKWQALAQEKGRSDV